MILEEEDELCRCQICLMEQTGLVIREFSWLQSAAEQIKFIYYWAKFGNKSCQIKRESNKAENIQKYIHETKLVSNLHICRSSVEAWVIVAIVNKTWHCKDLNLDKSWNKTWEFRIQNSPKWNASSHQDGLITRTRKSHVIEKTRTFSRTRINRNKFESKSAKAAAEPTRLIRNALNTNERDALIAT